MYFLLWSVVLKLLLPAGLCLWIWRTRSSMSLLGLGLPRGQGMWKGRPEKVKPGTLSNGICGSNVDDCWGNGEGVEGLEVKCPLRSLWLWDPAEAPPLHCTPLHSSFSPPACWEGDSVPWFWFFAPQDKVLGTVVLVTCHTGWPLWLDVQQSWYQYYHLYNEKHKLLLLFLHSPSCGSCPEIRKTDRWVWPHEAGSEACT